MQIIGLTGGISSGKSTVLKTLKSLGAMVIEVDKTAHNVMEPGQPAWKEIVEYFGESILKGDRRIDRGVLGAIVFNQPEYLKKLNQITHPRVKENLQARLNEIQEMKTHEVIVLEVPLLYESGMDKMCDRVWVVWVDHETQISRLMDRDGISRVEAEKRIASQMNLDEKAKRADLIIDNTGPPEAAASCAAEYYREFVQHSKTI